MFWVYKCNAKGYEYQRAWGDWIELFASNRPQEWGSTRLVPELEQANRGDVILAYQTDRNELVGIARVLRWDVRGQWKELILKPERTIGVKVRPLRKRDPLIAVISAFKPGPIHTLYPISREEANQLLRASGSQLKLDSIFAGRDADRLVMGGGFGTTDENKLVETAAIKRIAGYLRRVGWVVRDKSRENLGFDLLCRKKGEEIHVEVKGSRGTRQQFVLTANEFKCWADDPRFVLAHVGNACSKSPNLSFFRGKAGMAEFGFQPISYFARRHPNNSLESDAGKSSQESRVEA